MRVHRWELTSYGISFHYPNVIKALTIGGRGQVRVCELWSLHHFFFLLSLALSLTELIAKLQRRARCHALRSQQPLLLLTRINSTRPTLFSFSRPSVSSHSFQLCSFPHFRN